MESTTPFDLNRAIQCWKEGLVHSPSMLPENLEELESHLRDSIATLQTRELSAEEAFTIAAGRMGKSGVLAREFAKMNVATVWLDRALWMLAGVLGWGAVSSFFGAISSWGLSLGLLGGDFRFGAQNQVFTAVLYTLVRLLAIAGSIGICWWLMIRNGRRLGSLVGRGLQRPMTLVMLCIGLCVVSLAGSAIGCVGQILVVRIADPESFHRLSVSMSYASWFGTTIQTATIIGLSLVLARKRLRSTSLTACA